MLQPATCHLKAASPDDSPVLAALHGACFARAWGETEFDSFFAQGNVLAWIAYMNGQPAGFIFSWVVAGQCELLAIAVVEHARRHGLARQLLQALISEAGTRDISRIYLEVGVTNECARRLYLDMGFTILGRRARYYHHPDGTLEDAVTMAWEPAVH
jgi:ribosomal-protein-alanine N-acetyltransferase